MLFLKLLNAKIIAVIILGSVAAGAGFYFHALAVADAIRAQTKAQIQQNREGMKHFRNWRLK